jgi:3,4-dihydroxy 2-butanone 4-phosphate synthase/GTP cyclohydrolase II
LQSTQWANAESSQLSAISDQLGTVVFWCESSTRAVKIEIEWEGRALGFNSIKEAIEDIQDGRMVIVVDDEDRENEGDFTMAADRITPEAINFMARHGRGLICLAMTGEHLDQLHIPMMVGENTSKFCTAFTVSIEARHGVTTGISAADRATTILTAINPASQSSDLVRPGHIFPLRSRPGGVLERAGQTEASVDMARLAGLTPAGVICEIMNEDGTMARVPELMDVAAEHGLKIVTVADLIAYRLRNETFVRRVAESFLPTEFGGFRAVVFENMLDQEHHLALIKGEINTELPVLVRVQSQSTLGDAFHGLQNGSGEHLRDSLKIIESEGSGVLVYLRQEGKGAGLAREVQCYSRQEAGVENAEANSTPCCEPDLRVYGIGAQILLQLGIRKIRLLTDHPKKLIGLQGYGITMVEKIPLDTEEAVNDPDARRAKKSIIDRIF